MDKKGMFLGGEALLIVPLSYSNYHIAAVTVITAESLE
jgi:hypothetical protein